MFVDIFSTDNKYKTIYADPPWKETGGGKIPRGAQRHFSLMSTADIMALPIGRICEDNCHLYLWATNTHLPDGLKVMEAWGFSYKTFAHIWVKRSKKGTYKIGMGNWTRANGEVVLLGIKGKPKRKSASVRQIIESIPREHSRKPDEIYDRIEKLVGKNVLKIELFARHKRKG